MQYIFTNALITTAAYSRMGTLVVEDGRIKEIATGSSSPRNDGKQAAQNDEEAMTSVIARRGEATTWQSPTDPHHSEQAPRHSEQAQRHSERSEESIRTIDLQGKVLMAGGIDAHVHFREPGMEAKADLESESKAALLGGITTIIDMPNTKPPTVTKEALEAKIAAARDHCHCNCAFHLGATDTNAELLRSLDRSLFAGIKVFMGSSTGDMLVSDDSALAEIFSISDKPILIHSEDEGLIREGLERAKARYGDDIPFSEHPNIRSREACIRSTRRALELAIRKGTHLHVLHVSTAEEVEMISEAKRLNPLITAETSANYLYFCEEYYGRLGGLMKCNPAIKKASDRAALRKALKDGVIDTIGSDHAPHLLSEKQRPYLLCPSGVPSIEQSFSVILTVAKEEGIPLTRVASLMSEKAAELFGLRDRGVLKVGAMADLVVIDPEAEFVVGQSDGISLSEGIDYKCGWSPYEGTRLRGAIRMVMAGGEIATSALRASSQ